MLQKKEAKYADQKIVDMYHLPTPRQTGGAPAAYPVPRANHHSPSRSSTPPGCLCCPGQSSPTHFGLNKWALFKREVSKSLLTQLDSSAFTKAAQAELPLARMGS